MNNKPIKRTLNSENYVEVRVWYSKAKKRPSSEFKRSKVTTAIFAQTKDPQMGNVGHVTIKTPTAYASIWPGEGETMGSPVKTYKADFSTLVVDELSENGPSDVLVRLYSLNVDAIEQAFNQVKETEIGYVLMGDSSVTTNGHNCCTLSYQLLKEGGLDYDESCIKIFNTPNQFAEFMYGAKADEIKNHQETLDFPCVEGEYLPELPTKVCVIV